MQYAKSFCWNRISTSFIFEPLTVAFILVLLLCSSLNNAHADTLSDNPVLLTISGNIEGSTESIIEIDLKMLTSLESTSITTTVPWMAEAAQFKGVRINTLLESIGAKSNQFEAIAINEYKYILSDIDFDKYPIIIAYEKNGELLNLRSLGPLLIMFPFDDFPELFTEQNQAAAVWQLIAMHIH